MSPSSGPNYFYLSEGNQMYQDKTLVCKECGAEFVFTAGEQEFYAERASRMSLRDVRAAATHVRTALRLKEKCTRLPALPAAA